MFKKSLSILLFGAAAAGLRAQQNDVIPPYWEGAVQVLKGVSQYPVPSGILYNRAFPFSGLAEENSGTLPEWNPGKFAQAVHELEMASSVPPANPQGKKIGERCRKNSLAGELQLMVFHTEVQELDTGLIRDTSLVLENRNLRFNPKSGRQSPFVSSEMSAAVLMADPPPGVGKNYRIHFPENLPFGNQFRLPVAARIRFGENGWETILPSQPLEKNFTVPGKLRVEMEITWTGNLVKTYSQVLEVQTEDPCLNPELFRRPDECPEWFTNPEFAPSGAPVPIQAQIPFQGITGKGEIYYYLRNGGQYSPQNLNLKNPIIVVDGIDFGDARKGEVIYGKYLSYLQASSGPSSVRLGARLRSMDYDVIILNFPDGRIPANAAAGRANEGIDGGCDYIERNAMVLVKLIQLVNQHLVPGSKKITLVGPSMGGLISRYALAYMEKNSSLTGTHRCGLFISQDAPHLGANIPVGLQQMIENLAGFNVAKAEQALEMLRSPASSELLINHFENAEGQKHHQARSAFLQNCLVNGMPGSRGWPADPDLRMVSISNGNNQGFVVNGKEGASPVLGGGDMLSFNLKMRNPLTFGLLLSFFDGGISFITGLIASAGKMEWKSRYAPGNNGISETFRFEFNYSLFGENISLSSNSRSWQAFNSGVSVDGAPGGLSNNTEIIADGARNGIKSADLFIRTQINFADKFHCFVPTKSALAFRWNQSSPGDLKEAFHLRNLVCTGETPFHAYYCPPENEDHVRLNEGAANFIFSQLNYQPPAAGVYYPAEIIGPRAVSAGSSSDFSSVYTGTLVFRASWHISETSGISASVTNPSNSSCKVLTSSGPGQEDGYFVINLTTEVKTLNGDWVCAGMNSRKVFVRKTRSMGIIDVPCTTDLPEGCSFYVVSNTPDYSLLSNGVVGVGYEWQISRYPDSDFGAYCWENSLTVISSLTTTPYGAQKAYINLLHGQVFGMGNVFTYYVRVRNKMKMPNPDFGLPGEPQFLFIDGPWKMQQLQTTIIPGPNCPFCPGMLVVNPENPVKDIHNQVEIRIPEEAVLPGRVRIYDAEKMLVYDGIANTRQMAVSLSEINPGILRLVFDGENGNISKNFVLLPDQNTRLIASPQIVKKDFVDEVSFRLMDDGFLESGNGTYQAVLNNLSTGAKSEWPGALAEFSMPSRSLDPGEYQLLLSNGSEEINTIFEVLPEDQNPILIFPNPATTGIQVRIPAFSPENNPELRILNSFGEEKIRQPITDDWMYLKTDSLQPGMFLLQIRNGDEIRNAWFSVE